MSIAGESQEVVRMHATVRGESIQLEWCDGELSGDPELVQRARDAATLHSIDLTDAAAALRCLELVLGMRPVIDLVD